MHRLHPPSAQPPTSRPTPPLRTHTPPHPILLHRPYNHALGAQCIDANTLTFVAFLLDVYAQRIIDYSTDWALLRLQASVLTSASVY